MESNQGQGNDQDVGQVLQKPELPNQETTAPPTPRTTPTLPESELPIVVNPVVFSPLPDGMGHNLLPTSSSMDEIPPPKPDYYAPPPYEEATKVSKLPTYEEVQIEKHLEEAGLSSPINSPIDLTGIRPPQRRILTLDNELGRTEDIDTTLLGTDFMFYVAFFVAFIFNWIGFLLLMCFCHTIASRYGALSGFGLSLAKWTFIVQHSTELASRENSWLWWLIMTFGLIICIRAILQYLSIKRGWHMLSASHQERLLFFY